ncbi:MAG: hypothetical protein AAGA29_12330 [Planctomycetota bacterium]
MKQVCLLTLLLTLALPGCGASPGRLSAQNDELRRSNMELERAVDELSEQLALREQELVAMRAAEGGDPVDGVEVPRLVGIELDRLTGVLPASADAQAYELRAYVRPVDQDGRVMTVAGTARVRLVQTPADGDPMTLIDTAFNAEQWHAAYRDGITGTHYTFKTELPRDVFEHGGLTLHVALTDGATGRVYTAERVVALTR